MSASSSMTRTEIWPSRIRVQLYWANGRSEGSKTRAGDCKRPAQAVNRVSLSTKRVGVPPSGRTDLTQKASSRRTFRSVRCDRSECSEAWRRGWAGPLKGAKGAPVRVVGPPGVISVRRPQEPGAPLRCTLSPHGVPPRESPLPSAGLPPIDPPNDRHRVVAVLMDGYFAQGLSQPGPHWVAVALPDLP